MSDTPSTKPTVITICAASRHADQVPAVALRLTLAGHLVYAPQYLGRTPTPDEHDVLRAVHRTAISHSDGIHVVGTYIGQDVTDEIAYARQLGRFVDYEPTAVPA